MAKLAIAFADGVMAKIGGLAFEKALDEASLLFNFKSDFEWLKNQLRQICSSLQVADNKSGHTDGVKQWLAEVRNIVFDVEDIIDEYVAENLYRNSCPSCLFNCSELGFDYLMGRRIKKMKGRISSAVEDAQHLELFHRVAHLSQPSSSESTGGGEEFRTSSVTDLQDVPTVPIDYKVDEIVELLEKPAVRVVAVVGMGGLGKSFLMQHVFSKTKLKYDYSAWISVSKTWSLRSLQGDLAYDIHLEIPNTVSDVLAAELIHSKLVGRRCLIVLDDVWISDNLISRIGFPTGVNNQCKIVVTTRNRDVAAAMNAHIYKMQHLSEDESWNLFCFFAFPNGEGNRPPHKLQTLAHQIAEECGRLPLALKTVAASLANSSLISEWEFKLEQLKKIGKADDSITKISRILKLSYDSLPPNLRSCFAYLSFFPEDTYISLFNSKVEDAIHKEYVIYLWIAEGCIPQEEDREQFDIGLNYLHQLENLCLVEVNKVMASYTVHDLLLDLAVDMCKEHECEFDLPLKGTRCRRLVLSKKSIDNNVISERLLPLQFLRTLSLSQNLGITSIPEELLHHLRLLRVIDFSRTSISTLPKYVGNLRLLKVLNLSRTQIREVPDCVRRLKSLQFLDLSDCEQLESVPAWISDLISLSYLDVQSDSARVKRSKMPKGMSQLSNLRTLRSACFPLNSEDNDFLNVKDVGSLINLREIHFQLEDEGGLRSVEDGALDRLVNMRILGVRNNIGAKEEGEREESSTLPPFPGKISTMKVLQQLYLHRFSVPNWISEMESLTQLELEECSDYSALSEMPNLQLLLSRGDSKCRELPKKFGERGGFPKLFKLEIENFPNLEELPSLEEEAMQRLEGFVMKNCGRVKKLGEGWEQLMRLKTIDVYGEVSRELEKRLKEGGEDWNKMKALNPHIEIFVD